MGKNNKSRSIVSKLLHPSFWDFWQEGRQTPGYTFTDWVHGMVYGRWTYLYISIGTGRHTGARFVLRLASRIRRNLPFKWLFQSPAKETNGARPRGMAETYHGKVMPLDGARQLLMVNEDIRLTNLEKIIPYKRARDIILKNPDHIIALECPCRAAKENPCLPLDVCLIVGEPFASIVAEHHSRRSRWITQAEALDILQAEDERGHVHHAFFKDAMLDRFYAICNCCQCCCGAIQSHQHGNPMLASSGYLAQVDQDLCIGCETCAETCQFNAMTLEDYVMQIDAAECMGCGICVAKCEQGAISLERAPEKGEPLEIFRLLDAAS